MQNYQEARTLTFKFWRKGWANNTNAFLTLSSSNDPVFLNMASICLAALNVRSF